MDAAYEPSVSAIRRGPFLGGTPQTRRNVLFRQGMDDSPPPPLAFVTLFRKVAGPLRSANGTVLFFSNPVLSSFPDAASLETVVIEGFPETGTIVSSLPSELCIAVLRQSSGAVSFLFRKNFSTSSPSLFPQRSEARAFFSPHIPPLKRFAKPRFLHPLFRDYIFFQERWIGENFLTLGPPYGRSQPLFAA